MEETGEVERKEVIRKQQQQQLVDVRLDRYIKRLGDVLLLISGVGPVTSVRGNGYSVGGVRYCLSVGVVP